MYFAQVQEMRWGRALPTAASPVRPLLLVVEIADQAPGGEQGFR